MPASPTSNLQQSPGQGVRHLYVHFPFCPHVCPYCSFHVMPVQKAGIERTLDLLLNEFDSIQDQLQLETVFLGGGTPSALSMKQLQKLLTPILARKSSAMENPWEITCECNPSTLSPQKAEKMLSLGVNRLSVGAQSFDPAVLKTLGRTHSAKAIKDCFYNARSAGMKNINLDLIFGIPGQDLNSWIATLHEAVDMEPQHLSCYGLTFEEDTEFFRRQHGQELQRSDELERQMFHVADRILGEAGFSHYEISNYAMPGYESQHNLAYWRGMDYHAIGPSAVSTLQGQRRTNGKFDGQRWSVPESREELSLETRAAERMALGLRTKEGVGAEEFQNRFGFSPNDKWGKAIETLTQNGVLHTDPSFHLTPRGLELADEVATWFV